MKHLALELIAFMLLCSAAVAATKPNILSIMADDLGHGDVGFNGSKWLETPALDSLAKDRLAAQRMVFENAQCPGVACNPSRSALLSRILSGHRAAGVQWPCTRGDPLEKRSIGRDHADRRV